MITTTCAWSLTLQIQQCHFPHHQKWQGESLNNGNMSLPLDICCFPHFPKAQGMDKLPLYPWSEQIPVICSKWGLNFETKSTTSYHNYKSMPGVKKHISQVVCDIIGQNQPLNHLETDWQTMQGIDINAILSQWNVPFNNQATIFSVTYVEWDRDIKTRGHPDLN